MKRSSVDVAVIGGGGAGLVAAAGTAALGAGTVLIERNRLGGECTWTGCVPSKALLHIARQVANIEKSRQLGVQIDEPQIDFSAVMDSVRSTRRRIFEDSETPERLKNLGIRPLHASARFLDRQTLRIERNGRQREFTFRSAIIATGSRPFIPDIPGLDTVDFLTNETLFGIDRLPERLAILGGGAVGVEMAQAFSRLGSRVSLICHDDQLISEFDPAASSVLGNVLAAEGVDVFLRSTIGSVRRTEHSLDAEIIGDGNPWRLGMDGLLIATGRVPNTGSLDLDAAGISHDRNGITVDRHCRTNIRHILASGDVTPAPNQTHVGENMSKAAAINAVARLPIWKHESEVIPRVIYTDPEIAMVGRSTRDLNDSGARFDTIDFPIDRIDRAVTEHDTTGFIRVHHRFGKVLGATIVGPRAGEMIVEYAIAMKHGLSLADLSTTVHPYPTMMLGARRAADQIFFRALKPWMVRGVQLLYGYNGDLPDYIGTRTNV
ncbi:MAG: FAD-dependent oxidoreductase [Thermomicrobiales bacterium]